MNKAQQRMLEHLRQIQERGPLKRAVTVGAIDVEARTVELSFSSETDKVERWFGIEILGHDANEIDLSRMNNKAPLCWMHDLFDQRGVVVAGTARVDADRIARCTVRFAKDEAGETLFQRVIDDITTKVSVGYNVTGMRLVEERNGVEVYRITAWQPYEVSLVSAGADDDVGVGRALEKPQEDGPKVSAETAPSIKDSAATRATTKDHKPMKFRNYRDAQGNLCRVAVNEEGEDVGQPEIVEKAGAERAAGETAERARSADILALGDQYAAAIPDATELARAAVRDGMTRTQFQEKLLVAFNERASKALSEQSDVAHVGMSNKELKRYSFMTALRALANPNDKRAQEAAAFEIECSVAAQRTMGRTAQGILVPQDVLSRAAMSTTQADAGATLVENNVLRGSFIDLLRNRTIIMNLATVISGLTGNVDIPKAVADGQAYWVGEDDDARETGFKLGQISFSPKTLGAFTEITRKLLNQTDMSVEGMVRADLIRAIAFAIDTAGWYGAGTEHQPLGLANQDGLNAIPFDVAGQPSYDELVDMETEIAADNADIGSMAYVGNARFRGHCKKTLQTPGVNGSAKIWEAGNTVNGHRTEITNQVRNGDVFHGDFSQFVVGLWGGLDLTIDPYSLSKKGGLRIVAFKDVDMGLRRKESICIGR